MAKIVGGIATSHTPTIGFALDTGKQRDPVWAPIFEGYKPVQQWLAAKKPDVLFFIYNDHVTSFFFDHYSHFALGIGAEYPVADEGGGPRALPPIKGHPRLAQHIASGLVADEFDLSYFQGKGLDHGAFSPLSLLLAARPHLARRDRAAAGRRARIPDAHGAALLQARPRAAQGDRELSRGHQGRDRRHRRAVAPGARRARGFNNTPWDMEFMDTLETDPEKLTDITIADYATRGGLEGSEVVMWLDHARRALAQGEEAAPGVLPAVDDADRHADPRGRRSGCGGRILARVSRAHRQGACRHRKARRHLSVHPRAQREGVSAQRVSAPAHRARISQAVPRESGAAVRGGRSSPRKSATWSGGATGAR